MACRFTVQRFDFGPVRPVDFCRWMPGKHLPGRRIPLDAVQKHQCDSDHNEACERFVR
jgi:hypothetical protein